MCEQNQLQLLDKKHRRMIIESKNKFISRITTKIAAYKLSMTSCGIDSETEYKTIVKWNDGRKLIINWFVSINMAISSSQRLKQDCKEKVKVR